MKNQKLKKVSALVAVLQVGHQASGTGGLANTLTPVTMPVTPTVPTHTSANIMHDPTAALAAHLQNSTTGSGVGSGTGTGSGAHHNQLLHSSNSVTAQQGTTTPTTHSIIHAMVQASGYQTSVPTTPTVHTSDSGYHHNSAGYSTTTSASGNTAAGTSSPHMTYTSSTPSSSNPFNNLDLSSTQSSVVASSIPHFKDVTIQLQNSSLQVTGQTKITESEAAAVYQVLTSGHQSLVLNSNGVATGGTLDINKGLSHNLTELVVPQGVTVDDKVGHNSSINLANGLTNNGTLDFITLSSLPVLVTVSASNILNGQGAQLLLTQNPGTALSTAGTLALNYSGTFQNLGLINSTGALSVTGSSAGATPLVNAGTMQATHGDLSLTVPGLTNSGTLQALNGNLNISGTTSGGLNINNAGGHLSASNAININANPNSSTTSTANLNLNGGTLTANSINFVAPNTISVNAEQLNGPVYLTGANALVAVNGGVLNIASTILSGDPFLSNSNGDVNINSSQLTTHGDSFVALASGNVVFNGNGTLDTTVTGGGKGGDVTIGSGVTFSGQTISGTSTTGGDIELGGLNILTNGGNVTLDARAGTTSGTGGAITVGDIDTHAGIQNGQLNGGNVTISAANSSTLGNITTSGLDNGSGAGGNGGTVSITISKTGASLVVGNIDVHGGAGGQGANGAAGNGGDGGTGGSTFTASNYNLQGVGGTGGTGGFFGPTGGAGGAPGSQGSPGNQVGQVTGGTGGDGGTATAAAGNGTDGGNGGTGQDGGDASNGFKGYDGGDAGNITIKTSGAVTTGALLAYGGQGGSGGSGNTGGQGGAGGNGGHGDYAQQPPANQGSGNGTDGGNGGSGGTGGNAGASGASSNGNDGGNGGKGGQISVTTGGNFTISSTLASYQIDVSGGNGGDGGGGGRGQTGATGGNGGDGGSGGTGGVSGSTYTPPAAGQNGYVTPQKAGDGGNGGNGGNGGDGADGADGGTAGKGGDGGDAGNITITMPATGLLNTGAFGLNASIAGGFGGNGGSGGSGGAGGWAGGDSSKGLPIGGGAPGGLAGGGYTINEVPPGVLYGTLPQPPSTPGTSGKNGTMGTAGGQGDGGDGGDGGKSAFNGSFTFTGVAPNIYAIQGSTYIGSSNSPGYLPGGGAGGAGGAGKTDGQTGSDGASTVTSGLVTINSLVYAGSGGGGGGGGTITTPGGGSGGTGPGSGTGSGVTLGSAGPGSGHYLGVYGPGSANPGGESGGIYFGVPGSGTTPITAIPGTDSGGGISVTTPITTGGGTSTIGTVGVNDTNTSQELVQSKDPTNKQSNTPNYQSSSPVKTDNNTSYLPEPYRSLVQLYGSGLDNAVSGVTDAAPQVGSADNGRLPGSAMSDQPIKLAAFAANGAILASASGSASSSDATSKAILKAAALNALVVSDSQSINGWLKNVTTACATATTLDQTGNYLVVASQPTVVTTKFGKVSIAPGAVALVCYSDEDLNVLNLADNGSKSVIVESGGDSKRLHVGQQLLISKQDTADFSSINQLGQISWRRPVKQTFNGYRAFIAEFSVVSAIQQVSPLQQLLNSDDKQSKKFITNLLKVAVLISNGSH